MYFYTIASSSSGNCSLVAAGNTKILVDAGVSAHRIEKSLREMGDKAEELAAILLTHEHNDHISGVERLAEKYGIPVYASPKTWQALPFADKMPKSLQKVFDYDLQIGDFRFDFCKTSHDAVQPVGMVLLAEGRRLGYVTDTGVVTKGMLHSLHDLDGLLIEANHDREMLMKGPYAPFLKRRVIGEQGHLANVQTAELLNRLLSRGACRVMLAHLSETNNTPELARAAVAGVVARYIPEGAKLEDWLAVAPTAECSEVWRF
jgi:phosphoribosyl 1,2-cyclic phosphodiesterase